MMLNRVLSAPLFSAIKVKPNGPISTEDLDQVRQELNLAPLLDSTYHAELREPEGDRFFYVTQGTTKHNDDKMRKIIVQRLKDMVTIQEIIKKGITFDVSIVD